ILTMSDDAGNSNISAGIYKVPPEILICAFKLISPQGPQLFGRPYNDLVNITHSASYLRMIAINAPSLWTYIDITDQPSSFELAKACVQRSSPLNLDISIKLHTRVGIKLPGILALVEYVSTRTAALQVSILLPGFGMLDQVRLAFRHFKYPVLEKLEMDFKTKDSRDNPQRRVPVFCLPEDSPKLRSVSMVDLAPDLDSNAVARLTQLVLNVPSSSWPPGRFWEILGQAAALECLELNARLLRPAWTASTPFHAPSLQQPRTLIPNLHRLVLRGFESSILVPFLFNLDAPELFDVIFELSEINSPILSTWNDVQVRHPFPSVSSFELLFSFERLPLFAHQFLGFLTRLFPEVEELALPSLSALSILRILAQNWESPPSSAQECSRWPELYHLSITTREDACDKCWDRLDAVRSFIQTRSKLSLPPLEWVTVTLCESFKKDLRFPQVLQGLRKALASKNALELHYYTNISAVRQLQRSYFSDSADGCFGY
ncbi:hypothetical protein FRC01_009055, partial [Tulasnella sp. 417]